jgi:hypothetical protein
MSLSFLIRFGTLLEKDRGNAVKSANRIRSDGSSDEKPLALVIYDPFDLAQDKFGIYDL